MRTIFLFLLITVSLNGYAQDSIKTANVHSQIFSLAPMSKHVDEVNGLVVGVGHVNNKNILKQTINGINAEVNPAPVAATFFAFLTVIYLPEIIIKNTAKKDAVIANDTLQKKNYLIIKNWENAPYLKLNGLNVSTGCFFIPTSLNGLNVSAGNKFVKLNGVSIAPLGTISDIQNGLSLGFINASNDLNGLSIGIYNQTLKLDGLQAGVVNKTKINHGLQLGIANNSRSNGFQIGIWNKNARRSFPLVNW